MTNRRAATDLSEFDAGDDRQDELFDVLSHPRRRFALKYLHAADSSVSVRELTTELVAREVQRPVADRSARDRDAVEVSLVHRHLPKMDGAGLVEYDDARETITLGDRTQEVRAHLQTMASD